MSQPTPGSSQHDPTSELVTITPRSLAGPGRPGTALEVLEEAGWTSQEDRLANVHAHSPERRRYAGFLPEGPDPVGGLDDARLRTLWLIRAYHEPVNGGIGVPAASAKWGAGFSDCIPVELVAAFWRAVTIPPFNVDGPPGSALQVLDAAGWRVEPDELGNVHAHAPDRRVHTSYYPAGPRLVGGTGEGLRFRSLWMTRAYREPAEGAGGQAVPVWVAAFSDGIPVGLVTAFLTAVVDPAGIQRDPLEPHTMLDPPAPPTTT